MATFSIVEILKRELPRYGVPASTVSSLAKISPSKLSAYMNGVIQHVPNEDEAKLQAAWSQIKKLIQYASPLELNFRKVDSLRRCVEMMNDGSLKIIVFQSDHNETESAGQ